MEKQVDFKDRLLPFSVNVPEFLKVMPGLREYDVIWYQLSKSASSIGANLPCEII